MDLSKVVEYWENRCAAAEKYIAETPCDPDNTEQQYTAYIEWVEAVNLPIPGTPEEEKSEKERGWAVNKLKCDSCGFEWVTTYHINCDKLECKSCKNMVHFERID